jgi:hypothetical protein
MIWSEFGYRSHPDKSHSNLKLPPKDYDKLVKSLLWSFIDTMTYSRQLSQHLHVHKHPKHT